MKRMLAAPPAAASTRLTTSRRYAAEGIGELDYGPKAGRPPRTDDVTIVLATLEAPPPQRLEVTHRSIRLLAAELGLSNVRVARVRREYRLQPSRADNTRSSISTPA